VWPTATSVATPAATAAVSDRRSLPAPQLAGRNGHIVALSGLGVLQRRVWRAFVAYPERQFTTEAAGDGSGMEDQAGIDPLLPLNEVAWGLHKSTRRVRALLAEQKIPVVEFSPKERYIRHSA
jgi:hypothetical protein